MENFGIFCLFALLISVLLGSFGMLMYILNNHKYNDDEKATGFGVFGVIMLVDLWYTYYVFHHGLWMILRNR